MFLIGLKHQGVKTKMRLIKGEIIIEDMTEEFGLKVLGLERLERVEPKNLPKEENEETKKPTKRYKTKSLRRRFKQWDKKEENFLTNLIKERGSGKKVRVLASKYLGRTLCGINNKLGKLKLFPKTEPTEKPVEKVGKTNTWGETWNEKEKQELIDEVHQKGRKTRVFEEFGKGVNKTASSCYNQYVYLERINKIPEDKLIKSSRKSRKTSKPIPTKSETIYSNESKDWTETHKDTLFKEVGMTMPTDKNFARVGKLIGRSPESVKKKYYELYSMRRKNEKEYVEIGKDGSTKIEKGKKFNLFG